MSTTQGFTLGIVGWMVMGFVICWMRVNLSSIKKSGTDVATAWLAFWFWPGWFIWVVPTWIHEQVFEHEIRKNDIRLI